MSATGQAKQPAQPVKSMLTDRCTLQTPHEGLDAGSTAGTDSSCANRIEATPEAVAVWAARCGGRTLETHCSASWSPSSGYDCGWSV
jgi:hypothetical protein